MSEDKPPESKNTKPVAQKDPETDIFSRRFNPKKYLCSPVPYIRPELRFDNFTALSNVIQEVDGKCTDQIFKPKQKKLQTKPNIGSTSSLESLNPTERRFLPHQQLVTVPRKAKFTKNIVTKFENDHQGPIGCLKLYMGERVKVKIYTRKEHGVRGTITGYIEAFDKHWNMVVSSSCETWKRRKRNCSDQKIIFKNTVPESEAFLKLKKMGISLPVVTAKSLDRKYVQCTREVPQLMIRGEQVILVTPNESVNKVIKKN